MSSELDAFDKQIAGKDGKEDKTQYRVIEKMTDAELVVKHGKISDRPLVKQTFIRQNLNTIIYGKLDADLYLSEIHCDLETWEINTQDGAHVHMNLDHIRNGLSNNKRRKIDITGKGALVLRCQTAELESCYILPKEDMVFFMPLNTNGFIIRGKVKICCVSEEDEMHLMTLENFLEVKQERVKAVKNSAISQEPVKHLTAAKAKAMAIAKQLTGQGKSTALPSKEDGPSKDEGKGR